MRGKSIYNSLSYWRRANPKDYQAAYREGCVEELCEHFGWTQPNKYNIRGRDYWTLENCLIAAKKFPTKGAWSKGDPTSYQAAKRNGFFEECCEHMVDAIYNAETTKYPKTICLLEAQKHSLPRNWYNASPQTYNKSKRENWFFECIEHMGVDIIDKFKKTKIRIMWNYE